MARTYFDDGSWIETDSSGTMYASNDSGVTVSKLDTAGNYSQSAAYATDAREEQKLDPYVAKPAGDTRPWWERVAEYGLTRAIDSNYGPAATNKTSTAATYAGQNGQTYSSVSGASSAQSSGVLPLLLAGGLALFALS